jgi:hypothetical protein
MNSQGTSVLALQTSAFQDDLTLAKRGLQEKNMPITRRCQTSPSAPRENMPNMKKETQDVCSCSLTLVRLKNDAWKLKNDLLALQDQSSSMLQMSLKVYLYPSSR